MSPKDISDLLAAWAKKHEITLAFIQPENPQQNAYIERYTRTVRYDWLEQYLWAKLAKLKIIQPNGCGHIITNVRIWHWVE